MFETRMYEFALIYILKERTLNVSVEVRIKVCYIANSYLKTKRLIKEFLKRIVLTLDLKHVSFL